MRQSIDKDIVESFIKACKRGDIAQVQDYLNTHNLDIHMEYSRPLAVAFQWGQLELAQFLLNSKTLFQNADLTSNTYNIVACAFMGGHLEVVKYLLQNKEIRKNASELELLSWVCLSGNLESVKYVCEHITFNMKTEGVVALSRATQRGHMEIVDFLLCSPELKEHADINADNTLAIACGRGKLELVKYFLSAPHLKQHADIHNDNDSALKRAVEENHMDIIQYLLEDRKMKISTSTLIWLKNNNGMSALKLITPSQQLKIKFKKRGRIVKSYKINTLLNK